MEKEVKFTLDYIYPPNPQTNRGYNTHISCHPIKNKIVYAASNSIIIRDADDLSKIDVFSEHKFETSCARFSPNGAYVCSGDVRGNIFIWETEGLHPIKRQYEQVLSGVIKDIAWTSDNQRILVAGEAKNHYAKVFIMDTGSSVGEISNNSKPLNCCDIRPIKPYKIAVGGEETIVCFYEGPPFKYKKSHNTHTGFVNSIRFNPKGNYFISVSHDKKIILYDANTGEELKIFNHEGSNHEGAINFCDWFEDSSLFITASNDKTLKIWDPESGLCVKTLKTSKEPQIEDFQVGVGLIHDKIFSVSLSGAINTWKYTPSLIDGDLPLNSFIGHQGNISQIVFNELHNVLISGDSYGRIILWKDKVANLLKGKQHSKAIIRLQESSDKNLIYSVSHDDTLNVIDIKECVILKELELRKKQIVDLIAHKSIPNICYVVYEDNIIVLYENLESKKEIPLSFSPTAGDISFNSEIIALGDIDGFVHLIKASTGEEYAKLQHYNSKITCIRFSSDDKLLAVGETNYKLKLWDVEKRESLTDKWVYHSATITSITFNKSNKFVLTTSMDNGFYIWNCQTFDREIEAKSIHKNGICTGTFDNNGNVVTGGNDKLIRRFKLQVPLS